MRFLKAATFFSLFAAILLSACQVAGSVSDSNREALEGVFLQTHIGEVESDRALVSRAAVPYADIKAGVAIPTTGAVTKTSYPEYGQTTRYAIVATATPGIYKATVTTDYADWSVRASAREVYYIRDNAPTGVYGVEDEILAADLSTADTRYRETMETTYRSSYSDSSSVRRETIADDTIHALGKLDSLSSGSMVYDTVAGATLPTNAAALWSSKVTYSQSSAGTSNVVAALLGFSMSATYTTTGTRYYTEVPVTTTGYDQMNSSVWYEETKADGALVARTVTRENYYMNTTTQARSTKTVRTRSILYDSSGKKNLQLEKEGYDASSLSFY